MTKHAANTDQELLTSLFENSIERIDASLTKAIQRSGYLGSPKDEYLDISHNQRNWANMRFHSLAVFMAIMGGLFVIIFESSQSLSDIQHLVANAGAIIIVMVFWIMDERIFAYWNSCIERAKELEKELGFKQYTYIPRRGVISSHSAVRLLFVMFLSFWTANLIWG